MKKIKTTSFAAREPIVPLFWHDLTDFALGDYAVLIEQPISEYYYLNNSSQKDAEKGFKDYSNKTHVHEVMKKYQKAHKAMKDLKRQLFSIYFKAIFNIGMVKSWGKLTSLVTLLTKTYKYTEPARFEKIEKSKKTADLDYAIKELSKCRFNLKESFLKLEPSIKPLFAIIALRFKIKKDEFLVLNNQEMLDIFRTRKKPEPSILKIRKKGYAILKLDNKKTYLTGKEYFQLKKDITALTVDKQAKIIKGMGITKGKVKGRVKILIDYRQELKSYIKNFKQGDIIVTGMTQPDITILLSKAAAIVTEEGGITSHAAIISRESNTPCIIGAGPVTKILKDNELIEVDADKGVIRRL